MLRKKRAIISIIATVLIVSALVGYIAYANATSYVGTVEGERITRAEFMYFLEQVKMEMEKEADITSPEDREAFWNVKIDGVDAKELAKQNALEKSKQLKIQLIKAKEAGRFLNDRDYLEINAEIDRALADVSWFLNIMNQKDATRKEAEKEFKRLYGYSVKQYQAIIENLKLAHKFALSQEETITATREEVEEHYLENSNYFDTVTVTQILLYKNNIDSEGWQPMSEEELEQLEEKAKEILQRIKDGEDMIELAREYSDEDENIIEDINMAKPMENKIRDWAMDARVGQLEIIDTEKAFYIIRTDKRTSLDDVYERVESVVISNKYNELVEEWAKDPRYDIEINNFALDRIKVLDD
ncbi:UNVERIFIED_CONTAM: foldase protein PrsA [Acetivibrio alkalicellulosi]